MIDEIDAQCEPIGVVLGDQFTFLGMDSLNDVMDAFKKRGVLKVFGTNSDNGVAREPTPFVVGVKDLEVAPFDFNDQTQLLGKLKLVPIIFRSAIDEIADEDWTRLHP